MKRRRFSTAQTMSAGVHRTHRRPAVSDTPCGMDIWDVEGNASHLYQLARSEEHDPPGTAALAVRVLGPGCIRYAPRLRSRARFCRVEDSWRIYIRSDAPVSEQAYLIGHELAEWFYRDHQHEPGVEEACNQLSAALVAPRRAFAAVLRSVGRNVPRLARAFACSHTLIELRIPEVTGEPRAIVSRNKVWVRGEAFEPFTSENVLRTLAERRDATPGLSRRRVQDARHRVVLAASFD